MRQQFDADQARQKGKKGTKKASSRRPLQEEVLHAGALAGGHTSQQPMVYFTAAWQSFGKFWNLLTW